MPKFDEGKLKKLRWIDRIIRSIYLFPKNNKTYPKIEKDKVKEILIIGFMMIGDTIMSIPSLNIIKKNFPNSSIKLVGGKHVELVLKNQNIVDEWVTVKVPWLTGDYSLKNLLSFILSIKVINRKKYDLAIDFRGDWRNVFFMNFISSERKISFNYTGGEYMLTDVIQPDTLNNHYITEWLYLLKKIGCYYHENDIIPVLKLSDNDEVFINEFRSKNNLHNNFVIGIHPGASQEIKKWDEQKYAQLIIDVSKEYSDVAFIIFEGPNERETVAKVETICHNNSIPFIVANYGLEQYMLLISISDLIICNDSGAAHIAGAFGIPTIVIFGNVDPKFVTPYGAKIKRVISHNLECKPCHQSYCKFGHNLCIKGVGLPEVYNTAKEVIDILRVINI